MQSLFYPYNYPYDPSMYSGQGGSNQSMMDYDQLMKAFPSQQSQQLAMSGANMFNPAEIGFSQMDNPDGLSLLGGLMQLIPQVQQQQRSPGYMNPYVMSLMGG